MPIVYSAQALRQPYVPPAPNAVEVKRPSKQKISAASNRADPVRDAKLVVLWNNGESGPVIARKLGFGSRTAVYSAARRLGLARRYDASRRDRDMARIDEIIRACWPDRSITTCEIADRCGWNHGQAVTKRARLLGLSPRRRGNFKRGK